MPTRQPPKGFEDPQVRKTLAEKLCNQIDYAKASLENREEDSQQLSRMESWDRTQKVYDEAIVLSSLSFLKDTIPYNMPLMVPLVNGVVGDVAANITKATPYYILRAPGSDQRLEDAETVLHYALSLASHDRRVRDAGFMAALRGRGMLRVRYETRTSALLADHQGEVTTAADDDAQDPQGDPLGEVKESPADDGAEVSYSGLVIEAFKAEDTIVYPTWVESITDAEAVGHRFWQRTEDIRQKMDAGRYFDDITIPITHDRGESVVEDVKDYAVESWDIVARLNEPGEPEKRYRVTLGKTNREILDMEEYELPTVWYFAPAITYEIGQFWPSRSLADRLIELQTIYNDASSLCIFGTAGAAFQNVAVSGYVGQQAQAPTGICNFVFFRGNPNFTPIPSRFDPRGVQFLMQTCERVASLVARYSPLQSGQPLRPGATATEAEALTMGQQAGNEEYTANFGTEMARLADFSRFLLALNFDAFKEFHGEAVTCQKADLQSRCIVEVNGKSPAESSQAVINKINALLNLAKEVGIQPLMSGRQVNVDALMDAALQALDMSVSTSKILQDAQPTPGDGVNPNVHESINFKDLPPEGQAQLAAQAGIHLNGQQQLPQPGQAPGPGSPSGALPIPAPHAGAGPGQGDPSQLLQALLAHAVASHVAQAQVGGGAG